MDDLDNSGTSEKLPDSATLPGTISENEAGMSLGALTEHVETAAETPILNKDGTIRKKPGRKPGQKTGMAASDAPPDAVTLSPAKPKTAVEK